MHRSLRKVFCVFKFIPFSHVENNIEDELSEVIFNLANIKLSENEHEKSRPQRVVSRSGINFRKVRVYVRSGLHSFLISIQKLTL